MSKKVVEFHDIITSYCLQISHNKYKSNLQAHVGNEEAAATGKLGLRFLCQSIKEKLG